MSEVEKEKKWRWRSNNMDKQTTLPDNISWLHPGIVLIYEKGSALLYAMT